MKSASDHPMVQNGRANSSKAGSSSSENVKQFLASMDEMGILKFEPSDLEKGSMKNVMDCLSTLRAQFAYMGVVSPTGGTKYGSPHGDASSNGLSSSTFREEKRKFFYRVKNSTSLA
ncbi:hypothetical protein NC653_034077 [Populus alba x Populus x berolinensis]|uniref:Uncharacterized protein n=1 Tax=Populus alba x Populus x berolinensis TaxID=444605 RepID=A0AAD6LLP0_9ROSI|nr:hypothetical protein NC653_034077 [Populus alba x Populus x berolinensis]